MFSERSTIIHLGANMDNLGKILHVNVGATILTKYSVHELVNLNVNKIMTTTISNHHQGYLLRAFKKGVFSILYKEQRNFVVDKNGYASPISLLVKPMYNVGSNMFQYISYLQPIAKTCRYILTNPDGLVECFSENFGDMMGITPKQLNQGGKAIYIQTLMPLFLDFFLEKKLQGGCTNETIDDYIANGMSLKQYKLNIRQEISTKLVRFTDAEGVESFYPYPEDDSQFHPSKSLKHKSVSGKFRDTALKPERDARLGEEVKQLAAGTWARLLRWHKGQGSPPGVLYQVDLVFHPIKTSSTYIFVFQVKSVQVLNRSFDALADLGQVQFGHTRTDKVEHSLAKSQLSKIPGRGVVVDGNIVRIPTNSIVSKEPGASMMAIEKIFGSLGPDPQRLDSENKLLKLFGDFFTQQIFFEDPNRITKKFEHDQSESLEKNESVDSFLKNELSNEISKNIDSLKDSLGMDVISQLSSQNKASSTFSATSSVGNSRQEEDITSIPELEYYPQEYSLLKTSSVFLVSCSIIAIVVVLSIGVEFNQRLSKVLSEFNLYKDLDLITITTPTLAYLVALSSAQYGGSVPISPVNTLLKDTSAMMHTLCSDLGSRAENPSISSRGDNNVQFPPVDIHSAALSSYKLSLFWLSALQPGGLTAYAARDVLDTIFLNVDSIARGVYLRTLTDWTPNVSGFGLAVLLILLAGFVLSTTFAFWVQMQSAKCYLYLNKVYGIVTSFPAHVIKAQKMLVIDLYELLETKIEEKKVQVKIRKSGIRSEERAKLDLGLKTSGKAIGELEVPKTTVILGIIALLLLILAFDFLVLLNMGFFSSSSDQALQLNYQLMKLQIGLSGYTYSSMSRSLTKDSSISPLASDLQTTYRSLLENTLGSVEDSLVSLVNSDSSFDEIWTRYLNDQCQYAASNTILKTDLFGRDCAAIQAGSLKFGMGRALGEVARTLALLSEDPLQQTTNQTPTSQPRLDVLTTISTSIRVQSFLHDLVHQYHEFLTSFFSSQATQSLVTNLGLVASLAAVSSFAWYFLLKGFQKRILESKNVIATLPPLILQQNMRARKFLQAVFEAIRKT